MPDSDASSEDASSNSEDADEEDENPNNEEMIEQVLEEEVRREKKKKVCADKKPSAFEPTGLRALWGHMHPSPGSFLIVRCLA
eukprot:1138391-Pelagomonas_calceolata.AAC.3